MPRRKPVRSSEYDRAGRAVPLDLFPTGRVRFNLGAPGKEGEARRREIDKLWTWRAWDVLHALTTGGLDAGNVAARVKADGEGALTELRRDAAATGRGLIPTLDRERDLYIDWYERERKDRSYIQIRSRLKRLLEQTRSDGRRLADVTMDQLSKGDIEAALHAVSPAAGTQNSLRAALSGLYTWSLSEEVERARLDSRPPRWSVNPASKVKPRETHARTATATAKQVLALMENATTYQAAYLRVFLHLGLRKDELVHTRLHLDLDPVDWSWRIQAREPDARCTCPQCKGKGWSPKVKRSYRTLPVPGQPVHLRSAIAEYLSAYPCEPGDFLFRNPRHNGVWDEGALSDDFKALCGRAGVRYGRDVPGGIVIHDLRATCATELDRAGVSLKVIATLLGDSADTVMNKYLRVKTEELSDGIGRGPDYSPDEAI